MTIEDQVTALETAILVKDQRIAALETEVAGLRASLHSIFESSLASIRSQDAYVATIADLNLALQEELADATALFDQTFDELEEMDNRTKTLELQLLSAANLSVARRN
ncbi:hypothetical protein [Rhizobium sp. RAF56]|uniref:hypothetical protein n=1 Tax=Rhizobium sp. RAF56 TaxID=3233062 RepID=UPI003F94DE47